MNVPTGVCVCVLIFSIATERESMKERRERERGRQAGLQRQTNEALNRKLIEKHLAGIHPGPAGYDIVQEFQKNPIFCTVFNQPLFSSDVTSRLQTSDRDI